MGVYQGPQTLARGNWGEQMAVWALQQKGHLPLLFKMDINGTNQGGVDIVTLHNGVVWFIDNKALTRSGNVSSVTALTTNFTRNRAAVLTELTRQANDTTLPGHWRHACQQAVSAINSGQYVRAVTNANFTPDSRILGGVTQNLTNQGIVFLDLMA